MEYFLIFYYDIDLSVIIPQSFLFVNACRKAATATCSEKPLIKLRSNRHTNVSFAQ